MDAAIDIDAIADLLLGAFRDSVLIEPFAARHPGFDGPAAYDVLDRIGERRRAEGWERVGRKIGFTNFTLWELYGVDRPMFADVWDRTLHHATEGSATVDIAAFVQPRIEPEVVVGLRAPVPAGATEAEALACVEWLAPGFELVQCHFPGWGFTLPECTASFGLHAALVVGDPVTVEPGDIEGWAERLRTFELTLSKDGAVVAKGTGANVLGSPAAAIVHLAGALADQPAHRALQPGEIVTTGTVTDAQLIEPGQTWTSDYGSLGLEGLTLTLR